MNYIKSHGPIFILLFVIVFASFGRLMTTPLWNGMDSQILYNAHEMSQNTGSMFRHIGFYFSQPFMQWVFLLEYKLFGLHPGGYIGFNLLIHVVNSFVVYMLVHMLFPRKVMAVLAAVLFAFGVGSYGRIFMSVQNLEYLMLSMFHLLVLYFFIRNDFRSEGKLFSPLFILGLFLFLMTGLTQAVSFSLIGTLIAYKAFFYKWRSGRSILSPDIIVFVVIGFLFYLGQHKWGFREATIFEDSHQGASYTLVSIKNFFRYLNLMFFPLQHSPILNESNPIVGAVYNFRTVIRVFLTLSIISYSFFGFVFGDKSVRFFIAWTFISLLPFTASSTSTTWLNLSYLYLTSLGFCVILAAGATGTSSLLRNRKWRQYAPYIVPLLFVILSLTLSHKLDIHHRRIAKLPETLTMQQELRNSCNKRPVRIQEVPAKKP
jgi:hypothetical protein